MEIEVNGVKYREKPKPFRPKQSKAMTRLMAMAMMYGGLGSMGETKQRETPNVDIIEEYGLIQQKKSKLSRRDREWVVWQFERNFEAID